MRIHAFLLLALFSAPALLNAQKTEQESRTPQSTFPQPALDFLEGNFPGGSRARYYEEQNEAGRFLEAKFNYQGYRYSVKFEPSGKLYDIERLLPNSDSLPRQVGEVLQRQLSARFSRYKIKRLQEQLSPDGELLGYEIEIKAKEEGQAFQYFEVQTSPQGEWQSVRAIEQRPNDFLFF